MNDLSPFTFSREDREQKRLLPNQNYEQNYYRLVEAYKKGMRQLAFEDAKNADIWAFILRSQGLKPAVKRGFGPTFGDSRPKDNYTVYVGGFGKEGKRESYTFEGASLPKSASLESAVDKAKGEAFRAASQGVSWIESKIKEEKRRAEDRKVKEDMEAARLLNKAKSKFI